MSQLHSPDAGRRSLRRPRIVGIGGTTREGSSTEKAIAFALRCAQSADCDTLLFGGGVLAALPHYDQYAPRLPAEQALLDAVSAADGLIIGTPAYHGGVSGLVKNALDLLQDIATAERPYLDGVPVALIVTAYGWQATGTTLAALRNVVHALRGWPTPLGVAINSIEGSPFDQAGDCADQRVAGQIRTAVQHVVDFSGSRISWSQARPNQPSTRFDRR